MTAKSWAEIESKVVELERENVELKQALIRCFDYADNVPLNRDVMVDAFGDIRGVVRETGILPDDRN